MKKIGALILAVGLVFGFAGCKTSTEELTLTKIEITNPADKVEYLVGEDLDTTGLEITATYSDESTQVVTGWIASGYDKTKTGEQTVTVSYIEEEVTVQTSYTVTVKEVPVEPEDPGKDPSKEPPKAELTKIEITTEPAKKEYFVGEELNTAGIKVTATLSDSTEKDVTADVKLSGYDKTKAGEQTVTVSYTQNEITKTAEFKVTVKAVEVTKIEITKEPTKKEYFTGATALDLTGMVVTATYNDGTTKDVTANVTTSGFDSSVTTDSQTITVTYNGKTATFTVKIKPFNWYETPEQLPAGTPGTYGTEGTYVLFGVWPQDVVAVADEAVLELDETATTTIERGYLKFVRGSDGNYYVKCAENANGSGYKYKKDDSYVKQGGTTSRWFKVMPIKWRVADPAYKDASGSSQGKLLVAENILTANVPYYEDPQNDRIIDGKTVYPNNYKHSQIRAYLNGYKYTGYDTTSSSNVEKTQWNNKGFLQTAFTSDVIDSIITTKVDNSKEQMSYDGTHDMDEKLACDPTDDKIFLLSEYEVTKYSKSTEAYDSHGKGNSRIRVTTDFAKANYAYQSTTDYGGDYWLRSPLYGYSYNIVARYVYSGGGTSLGYNVNNTSTGVVPALSISF